VTAEEKSAAIRKLQERAIGIATAAAKEDIAAGGATDTVYVVIAARQVDAENFCLGSGIGHTTAMTVEPHGVRLILKTALDTVGNELPS
jgi:hypothetical protein